MKLLGARIERLTIDGEEYEGIEPTEVVYIPPPPTDEELLAPLAPGVKLAPPTIPGVTGSFSIGCVARKKG